MKRYTLFALTEDRQDPIRVYGWCRTKAEAIGNLVSGLHLSVEQAYPEKYAANELDISMTGVRNIPDGLLIEMTVRELGDYHELLHLVGYAVLMGEIEEDDE